MRRAHLVVGAVATTMVVGLCGSAGATVTPRANCQPGDRTETGLQGQVPLADRLSGRAARGYYCNLAMLGTYSEPGRVNAAHPTTAAWATLDSYEDCAYYGDSPVGLVPENGANQGGTVVLDVSNPARPVQTDYLTTPAMRAPWEALRVNARRGLLAASPTGSHALDIYDLASDCRHPRLLWSGEMPDGKGHEQFFAPDGNTLYVTDGGSGHLAAVDLTDPEHPKQLGYWAFTGAGGFHGGSVSEDGDRVYQCEYPGYVRILDVSGIQDRTNLDTPQTVARVQLDNVQWCQATYPVTHSGHPFLIQYGENTVNRCPQNYFDFLQGLAGNVSNFNVPQIIDIGDPSHPQLASQMRTEVDEPVNCPLIQADISPRSVGFVPGAGAGGALFQYDTHHCSPDRLHDPTILACGAFLSGLRIWDIRNPWRPRELAYYNTGTVNQADQTVDDAISRPVIRTDAGLVYWTTEFGGFHVGEFENGVWPFAGHACGDRSDYYFAQYNPRSRCFARHHESRASRPGE